MLLSPHKKQDPGTAAAAAPLQPPGPSRCPGLTPSSGGHRGAFFPPKIKQSPLPGAASSEPLRDGRLAWASPRRCCGAHRDSPPQELSLPLPSPSVSPSRSAAFWGAGVCLPGPAGARGEPPGSAGTAPLPARPHRGEFNHPLTPPVPYSNPGSVPRPSQAQSHPHTLTPLLRGDLTLDTAKPRERKIAP